MGSFSSSSPILLTIFLTCALFPYPSHSGPVSISSIKPKFTATYFKFIDNSGGTFLSSQNNTFQAKIITGDLKTQSCYFVVIHVEPHTIIWSANRNFPISKSSELQLTRSGLTLFNDTGQPVWSTPKNLTSIAYLQLLETGNLVLIDDAGKTVWESFDSPTDLIVVGQKLKLHNPLISSVSDDDMSEGEYSFVIGDSDAMLRWKGMNYWILSMSGNRDSNFAVEYMVMNLTGVYLMGQNGEKVVMKVILNDVSTNSLGFRVLKVDQNGVLSVLKIHPDKSFDQEFKAPDDSCRIPFICKRLGVCTNGGNCQCSPAFHSDPKSNNNDCVPTDSSLTLPESCHGDSSTNVSVIKYLNLRSDLDYFSTRFTDPVLRGVNLSECQDACSKNCSCLGILYGQESGACHLIRNYLGSVFVKSGSGENSLGYVKTILVGSLNGDSSEEKKSDFPVLAAVLLPSSGVMIVVVVAILILLRRRRRRRRKWGPNSSSKLGKGRFSLSLDKEVDFVSIPGLPVRFEYKELLMATDDFKTQIGSGGFGTVYKGTLPDGTDIAVKKITCLGSQGNREFLTEIAVIGKIHHVNLVKLRGFCAQRGQRFLVYEYMDRGSLDRTLFGEERALEWKDRYEIALGTARGLAYLHTGCDHKIIHCDIKPENILLHEKSQVKLSDFGLSKLLTPEESGLFTTMRGTRGYLAPEWLTSSAISDKSDVYSFGMVLLEIIRGRKNSSTQTRSNNSSGSENTRSSSTSESGHRPIYFPLLALEMHEEGRYGELVDSRLTGRVGEEEVEKLVRVALCCVQEEPNLRPTMSNVVGMLEGLMPLGNPRMESLNFLRFYGRRFTEVSTVEENDGQNEFAMYRRPMTNNTSSSNDSFSYMSSQQVSGPR